jgi:hypothetical protein
VFEKIIKAAALAALVSLSPFPAAAQPDIVLPHLEIRVGHRAPPPLRREHRIARPGRDFVWVDGQWDWQGDNWAWVPGRWDHPTARGSRWVKARYRRENSAWRYEPGHWSDQRLVEGDDYRRWRDEHRGRHRGHDHDRRDDRHDNH